MRDGGLYRDFKVRVLLEKASLVNARGLWNPGKVRRRVFGLTSQTLKYFKGTLKYFKGTSTLKSTVLLSLISPAFPWENFKSATYFEDSSSSIFKRLIKH